MNPGNYKAGRTIACFAVLFGTVASAEAAPVTLICNGSITIAGYGTTPIENETSVVDYDKGTVKPPLYPAFPITKIDETTIVFGAELPGLSNIGNLDRVSGNMTMNVMNPRERQIVRNGGSGHFIAYFSAKCTPAQKMF